MAALGHFRLRGQRPHPTAGAAALGCGLLGLGLQHGGLIVGRGFPGLEGDCPGGAAGQAVPQAVAIVLPGKVGLAANEGNGPLVAGLDAQAAAIAFFLIDMNDLTNHRLVPPFCDSLFSFGRTPPVCGCIQLCIKRPEAAIPFGEMFFLAPSV